MLKLKFIFIFLVFSNCKPIKTNPLNLELFELNKLSFEQLWENSLAKSLKFPLWESRFNYDAGHFLMVPMHSSFCSADQEKIQAFDNHFEHFLKEYKESPESNDKARLQYFYLVSQYTLLTLKRSTKSSTALNSLIFLKNALHEYWLKRDAWHWSDNKFIGQKNRVIYKLNFRPDSKTPKHYGFIFDDEKHLFAIAADVVSCQTLLNENQDSVVLEILEYAWKVYNARVVFTTSSKWLMQPGYLSDHGDYAFSGYSKANVFEKKRPKANQSEDSSHSLRYPLWILSMQRAFVALNDPKALLFNKMYEGLVKSFKDDILRKPNFQRPYYHLTNFMDGSNGLYAWKNLNDTNQFRGFSAYELSFSFNLGWWAFLNDKVIFEAYEKIDKDWTKAYVREVNVDNTFLTRELLLYINKSIINLRKCQLN